VVLVESKERISKFAFSHT